MKQYLIKFKETVKVWFKGLNWPKVTISFIAVYILNELVTPIADAVINIRDQEGFATARDVIGIVGANVIFFLLGYLYIRCINYLVKQIFYNTAKETEYKTWKKKNEIHINRFLNELENSKKEENTNG